MTLQVGDKAPQFTLPDTSREDVSLPMDPAQNVVLLFVPLAFSGVCTAELCDVSQGLSAYEELGARVLAISVDSPFALKSWADQEGITLTLLSDFNKEVSAAYGAQYDDFIGLKGVAKRSAFVIDKEGVIRHASVSDDPTVLPDFEAIQACLQALE
jgi:peroxiredoxin